jgi:hypothetical protein
MFQSVGAAADGDSAFWVSLSIPSARQTSVKLLIASMIIANLT